jgi:membrane fusion protein (multidrug efflux system)
VLLGALAVAAVGWTVRTGLHAYRYETTDDAYVTGHLYEISAQVDGQVKEVLVSDNQAVHAGDVLFRLDPLELEIGLEKAAAAVTQAQAVEKQAAAAAAQASAAIDEAQARVAQGEAQVEQNVAQAKLARLTLARSEQLMDHDNVVSQSEVDAVRSAAQVAESASRAAQASLTAARTSVRSAESAQAAAHAQMAAASAAVATAEAARREAERMLALTTVKAPADGRVGNRHLEPGNRVQAGQAVLALAGTDSWIIANFKETQIARMTPGREVDLEIDAVPDHALHGKIDSIAPASGAKFALLPPDNATGNFNKVVQRIPVKIIFDANTSQQLGDKLRLGLSTVVDVRVR